ADHRVLFLEGEQLLGAKQNRILNLTVLVPARSRVTIPVSCVEAGRWTRTSAFFSASRTVAPHHLRHTLKSSVTRSLKERRGHLSDQREVWEDVRRQQAALGVSSGTAALFDTYATYRNHIVAAKQALPYVPGASGLAVGIGPGIISVDLFDKPRTCRKVWNRLLRGSVLEALMEQGQVGCMPDAAQVLELVGEVRNAKWSQTAPVGEGEEFRTELDGKVASALLLDDALVHASVVCACRPHRGSVPTGNAQPRDRLPPC